MFSTLLCTHLSFFFFFNDTATTEIYTLSLHDALPICALLRRRMRLRRAVDAQRPDGGNALVVRAPAGRALADRKSTRLNSSHDQISYAVFCLKKKNKNRTRQDEVRTTASPQRRDSVSN